MNGECARPQGGVLAAGDFHFRHAALINTVHILSLLDLFEVKIFYPAPPIIASGIFQSSESFARSCSPLVKSAVARSGFRGWQNQIRADSRHSRTHFLIL